MSDDKDLQRSADLQRFRDLDAALQDIMGRIHLAEFLEQSYGMPGDVARSIAREAGECKKVN